MGLFSTVDVLMTRAVRRIGRLPRPLLVTACIFSAAVLAIADLRIGQHLSLAVFYLVPVSIITWFAGRIHGLAMATACGALWFYASINTLPSDLPLPVVAWAAINRVTFFLLIMWLIAALKSSVDHHKSLASTDEMTGTSNRRAFLEAADREIGRSRRSGTALTVVFADCDNLKQVNDKLGHAIGDAAIKTVASTIKRTVRQQDLVARLGGDEFAILLPETDAEQAQTVVRKLRDVLESAMNQRSWPITLSMGVVTFLDPPADPSALLDRADRLQYSAKHGGKNKAIFEVVGGKLTKAA